MLVVLTYGTKLFIQINVCTFVAVLYVVNCDTTWRTQTGQSNVKTDEDLFHNQLFKTIYDSENVLFYNSL